MEPLLILGVCIAAAVVGLALMVLSLIIAHAVSDKTAGQTEPAHEKREATP